jgi:hypothetical protein
MTVGVGFGSTLESNLNFTYGAYREKGEQKDKKPVWAHTCSTLRLRSEGFRARKGFGVRS